MKIVIDIPKEDYDTLINHNNDKLPAVIARNNLWEALKHGTPLPKGHGRLIDADSFVQEHPLAFVRDVINDTPTLIEADKGGQNENNNARL